MDRAHEPSGLVRADWQQREIEWSVSARDLCEFRMVRGVTREVDGVPRSANDPGAPQAPSAIAKAASTEMLRRHTRDLDRTARRIEAEIIPPIELSQGYRTPFGQQRRES